MSWSTVRRSSEQSGLHRLCQANKIAVVSLFSGVGGLDLGMSRQDLRFSIFRVCPLLNVCSSCMLLFPSSLRGSYIPSRMPKPYMWTFSGRYAGNILEKNQVEANSFCRQVLAARIADKLLHPGPLHEDVLTYDGSKTTAHGCGGGFPCQARCSHAL